MSRAHTTRRDLFGSGAALLLLAAPAAGSAKAEELDGALLAACAAVMAAVRQQDRLEADPDYSDDLPHNHPLVLADEAEMDRAVADERKALRLLAGMPPRTPEGLRAKADTAVTIWRRDTAADGPGLQGETEDLLVALAEDVAGRAGA